MNRILVWVSLTVLSIVLYLASGCGGSGSAEYTLRLEPNGLTVKAGEEVQLSPTVLNNGVPMENPQVTWQVTGDIGTITDSGLFTATTTTSSAAPVTGTIEVSGYGQTVSIPVTVTVGALASFEIIPPEGVDLNAIPTGSTVAFTAEGQDAYGNRGTTRIVVSPTWSVSGNIGTIDANGLFTAIAPGAGTITATAEGLTDEIDVTVVNGPLGSLQIVTPSGFNPAQVTVGQTVTFTVNATGVSGNPVQVTPTWQVQGGIGAITDAGVFTATMVGQGAITATANGTTASLPIAVTKAFDGKIAFVCQKNGASNLCVLFGDGSLVPLSTGNNYFTDPDWSPDGSTLLFVSQGSPLNGICAMNADGSNPQQLYASRGQDPVWSPDGTKIAFANGLIAGGEINLIDNAGAFLRKLFAGGSGAPQYPCWSPDGRYIACSIPEGLGLSDGVYVAKSDGSNTPVRIYNNKVNALEWNPCQSLITMANDHQILGLPIAGGSPVTLVEETDMLSGGFAWSPDGSAIAYGVLVNGKTQLRMKILGSDVTFPLTTATDSCALSPTWTE